MADGAVSKVTSKTSQAANEAIVRLETQTSQTANEAILPLTTKTSRSADEVVPQPKFRTADEAIVGLETLTSQTADPKTLIQATYESVDIITPWVGATSDNHALQTFMVSLRTEAKGFVGSVTQSYSNAQSGYEFAKKATQMCMSMLDTTNTDEEIQDLITEMREIAQKAHDDATNTANSFRANRIGFNNVIASIPEARESMDHEHGQDKEKKDRAAEKAESWGKKINKLRNRKKRNIASDLIAMPYVAFAKSRQSSLRGKAKELETKLIRFGDAAKSFQDAEHGLANLMDKMNTLADYWLAMDSVLEDIHGRVDELRLNNTFRIKIKCLATDWNQVGLDYGTYKKALARLEDLHPTIKAITHGKSK